MWQRLLDICQHPMFSFSLTVESFFFFLNCLFFWTHDLPRERLDFPAFRAAWPSDLIAPLMGHKWWCQMGLLSHVLRGNFLTFPPCWLDCGYEDWSSTSLLGSCTENGETPGQESSSLPLWILNQSKWPPCRLCLCEREINFHGIEATLSMGFLF